MHAALDKIAALEGQEAFTLNWAALRYQHTLAIRARLAADYAPATANKLLSALRGVLKEAWRLGQMSAEDYQRAVDLENIKAQNPARRSGSELWRHQGAGGRVHERSDTCWRAGCSDHRPPGDLRGAAC